VLTELGAAQDAVVALGHHGYCEAPGLVTVMRRLALAEDGALVVEDDVRGAGEHDVVLRVQWAPDLAPEVTRDGLEAVAVAVGRGRRRVAELRVRAEGPRGEAVPVRLEREAVRHSPRYGVVEPSSASVVRLRTALPLRLRHELRTASGPFA
jgi:hypothetical protein